MSRKQKFSKLESIHECVEVKNGAIRAGKLLYGAAGGPLADTCKEINALVSKKRENAAYDARQASKDWIQFN